VKHAIHLFDKDTRTSCYVGTWWTVIGTAMSQCRNVATAVTLLKQLLMCFAIAMCNGLPLQVISLTSVGRVMLFGLAVVALIWV
jgi:hypothetical protein